MHLDITYVFVVVLAVCLGHVSAEEAGNNTKMTAIDDFLRRMEQIIPNNCSLENLGPGVVQGLARDRFKQQAMTAVSRANLLTYLWKNHPEALSNQAILFVLVTNLVESDDQIFAAGNCYDYRQFNDSGIFCPYGFRDKDSKRIIVKDLGKTHSYDDITNPEHEWFHEIRRMGNKILDGVASRKLSLLEFHFPDKATPVTYKTLRVKYDDGHWSLPYYDCGGGNIWMITYTVPFFGYDHNISQYVFKGSSGIDIDLMKVDINQCTESTDKVTNEKNVFADSHKCKATTKCVPIAGKGFKRGSYSCACRIGYYFPLDLRSEKREEYSFNGTDVEKEYDKKMLGESNLYDVSFDCIKCAPGCDSCSDDSPCIYPINWFLRSALLGVMCIFMLITVVWFGFVHAFRTSRPILAASPMLLHIILFGALLSYFPIIVHYFKPKPFLCIIQFWLRDIGFSIIYAAILFKTWRISVVFRPFKHRNVKITDIMLLKRIAGVVSIFVAFCTLRTIIGRPKVETSTHSNGMKVFSCSFDFWDYGMAVCKIILLLWGISLTISVRKTPSEFNESRFISWAIYNETIMAIFFNVSMFFLNSNADPDLFYILIFLHIQLTVTGTTVFLFASKVYHIFKTATAGERQRQAMRFVRSSAAAKGDVCVGDDVDPDTNIVGVAALVSAVKMQSTLRDAAKSRLSKPKESGKHKGFKSSKSASSIGGSGQQEGLLTIDDISSVDTSKLGIPLSDIRTDRSNSFSKAGDVVTVFFQLPETITPDHAKLLS